MKNWILLQAATKPGNLKVYSGGDIVMSSDAKYIIKQHTINWSASEHITVSATLLILSQPNASGPNPSRC